MLRPSIVALSVLLSSVATVAAARADDPNDAQRRADALFFEARQLMAAGKYGDACPKLAEASRAHQGIGIFLNLGDCDAHIGKIGSAWNAFHDAAEAAKRANDEREREARARMAELEPHLNRLTIAVAPQTDGAPVTVRLDGVDVDHASIGQPLVVDPGAHTIEAKAAGRKPWTSSIEVLSAAMTVTVPALEVVAVAPAPPVVEPTATPTAPPPSDAIPPPPSRGSSSQRTWALVAGGVGIAGVAVGSIFGILSLSHKSDGNSHCNLGPTGSECDAEGVQARSSAISTGNVSTVAYVVGVAGLAAGAVLWFTAPSSTESSAPSIGLGVGPATASLVGRF
jgi:hypothetical protein